jgi:D-inositol-3-phosphate glycosyltransferase
VDPRALGVHAVAMLSVHTSPLAQPGTGDGGGLNVYVLQAARRLADRGVHVDIFTRREREDQPSSLELGPGLFVHHVTAGPVGPVPKGDLPGVLCSFMLAMRRHPTAGTHDLLHANYWLSGWVGRRLSDAWNVPLVTTFHTLGTLKNASLAPGDSPEPALRLTAERRVAHASDRITAMGCEEARALHRSLGVSGRRIDVVPAGVDNQIFRPTGPVGAPDLPPSIRHEGERLLLFAGRLQPLKGPDVAIATLADVVARGHDARLVIVGGTSGTGERTSNRDRLRDLADALGVRERISLLPARPHRDLAALYRAADVVLVPSRSETFGLVALEAQACGTPVVAARVGGMINIVEGGGTLVAGHDPSHHGAAVDRYLSSALLSEQAGRAGVETARGLSWDGTVQRLLQVYGAALADRALSAAC